MFTAMLIFGAVLVAAIVLLFIVISMQPATFRIERSATMAAPASEIFRRVDDLHRFQEWSPWAKIDPACKLTYEGPGQGVGASCAWAGNNKVGSGRMTIVESRPAESICMKLQFLRPFKATNQAEYTFIPQPDGTKVSWIMTGEKPFISKAFGMFCDMDKLVGNDFEKGLASLKALSEGAPAPV